uniref:Putative asparagine synthase n=1 Tax=viral metagenome TaxID=1070528 RepID=A0A6H1ZTQ6_9ZZZZ
MCRSFSYRGPDDEGVLIAPPIGLGHRRLSIIDLSPAGNQPMCNEDGTIWLVFNGEIYDFERLRQRLKSRGHRLKSRTDCETIIHLYEDEGVECLKELNGMFAFALWDSPRQILWLVRDRLGIKPLIYWWDGRRLVFASEIKAILCDPEVRKEIDGEAFDLYLTLNYVPAPWTIFKNIRKLEPGSYLLAKKGEISVETYWDLPLKTEDGEDYPAEDLYEQHRGDPSRQLRLLLEEAVKRRLIADVPLGAFLSGGIDSSIIVSLMARNSGQPVKTFSIGYKDLPYFDETRYAREVAELYHTEHHEFKLGYRDLLDVFPTVLQNLDEPFADSSIIPTYIVSRETKKHVTVALSGDGGDELFAGYRMYLGEYWSRYYSKIPLFLRDGLLAPIISALPDARDKPGLEAIRRIKKFVRGMNSSFPERFCAWREIFPLTMREALLKEPPGQDLYLHLIHKMFEKEADRFPGDILNLMLFLDIKGLLPGDMLNKVDRMSMLNSLEVRVPFLDYTLVEFVFRLRGDMKLKGRNRKFILMQTFKDLLPPSLLKRPKWGFEIPIGAWLRNDLKFLIDEYLTEDLIKRQGLFHFKFIRDLISQHMNNRRDTSWQLWNLIVFQHWYKTYL